MTDWKTTIRERLSALNLPYQLQVDVLEIETAKAIAETDAFVGLGSITDDSTLWAIQKSQTLSTEQKQTALAEEANRLAAEKVVALTDAERWRLQTALEDSF